MNGVPITYPWYWKRLLYHCSTSTVHSENGIRIETLKFPVRDTTMKLPSLSWLIMRCIVGTYMSYLLIKRVAIHCNTSRQHSLLNFDAVWPGARIKSSPIVTKVAQKKPKQLIMQKRGFKITESCPIFGLILWENMFSRLFKRSPIRSHCFVVRLLYLRHPITKIRKFWQQNIKRS